MRSRILSTCRKVCGPNLAGNTRRLGQLGAIGIGVCKPAKVRALAGIFTGDEKAHVRVPRGGKRGPGTGDTSGNYSSQNHVGSFSQSLRLGLSSKYPGLGGHGFDRQTRSLIGQKQDWTGTETARRAFIFA